jgi:hypothetical protein
MNWNWFDLAWPWIGLGAAAILLVLLFTTEKLRGNTLGPRWRDPVWLAWLIAAVYFVHNFEEYGIDALGEAHAFPLRHAQRLISLLIRLASYLPVTISP